MKVVYTAPNRGHHYRYALALHQAGALSAFISGFSRFSPRSGFEELGDKLRRHDVMQNVYLASLKLKAPNRLSANLAYLAKIEQDLACGKYVKDADVFLFYNGSGLSSCKKIQISGGIGVVEAVNSHVQVQEDILEEEHRLLNLPWQPFHQKEKERRLKEYNQADYILMPSDFVKNSFLKMGFPERKLLKVPFGFSQLATGENRTTSHGEDFIVLYVGSISVRKGVRYLIEAFNKLKHPKKKLRIVGPLTSPTGLEGVPLNDDIVFTGPLKGKDLEAEYQSADVFCLPSLEEGLALVLGEALSYGIPIIATTNSGATEIITEGVEGFIVPPKNRDAIYLRLQELVDDQTKLTKMRALSFEKSKSLKGWDDTGKLLVSTLTSVIKSQHV